MKISTEGYDILDKEQTGEFEKLRAIFFLVSSSENTGQHLRILAHLAEMVDSSHFLERWKNATNESELREILLRDERFINITVSSDNNTRKIIGKEIKEIDLPGESLVAILKRKGELTIPHGNTVIKDGDELSIIGNKQDIDAIKMMTQTSEADTGEALS
jgi:NhaP-type Na+/H+ and K+/H+ antiporter